MKPARFIQFTALAAKAIFTVSLFYANLAAAQENPQDTPRKANQLVDALIKKVAPSVVQILVTSYGPLEQSPGRAGGLVGQQRAIGSGFVIDSEGYIMTNAHVVRGAQRIQVILPPPDSDASEGTAPGAPVVLQIQRDSRLQFLAFTLE